MKKPTEKRGELDSSNHLGWMSRASTVPLQSASRLLHGLVRSNKVVAQNGDRCHCKICIWTRSRTALAGNTSALEFQIGQFIGCWKIPWHCITGFEEVCFISNVSATCVVIQQTQDQGIVHEHPARFKFETFTGDFIERQLLTPT